MHILKQSRQSCLCVHGSSHGSPKITELLAKDRKAKHRKTNLEKRNVEKLKFRKTNLEIKDLEHRNIEIIESRKIISRKNKIPNS